MAADPVARTRLTEAHRQLVRILAEAAVEQYLDELKPDAATPPDDRPSEEEG